MADTPEVVIPGQPERPKIPEVPPKRTFAVRRPDRPNPKGTQFAPEQVIEAVEGHQVEISAHGDLLVFEFTFTVTEGGGYQPSGLLRRAFAAGQWLDLNEVMIARNKILYN